MLATQAVDENGQKVPFPTKRSSIYGVDLIELNYDIENYILSTAWSTVKNNPDIMGVGAFFEPYAYDKAIKDYTIYVGDVDAKNKTAQSYGTYSEYSANDYYKQAATSLKPCFTSPYVDNNITMVTASYPIVSGGELQGVIVVDINVNNFAKIKSSDDKYKTMYANVITQDGIYVYDSSGLEWSGQDIKPYFPKELEYQQMMEKMKINETFDLNTTRENGTQVARYCYPIQVGEELWWAQSVLDVSDLNKDVTSLAWMMIIMAVVALVAIIIVITILLKRMLKPISGVVDAATQIAQGNFDIDIKVKSQDEIGLLSKTFVDMAKNLKAIISEVDEVLGEMADGNFQVATKMEEKYIGQYRNILMAMRNINLRLSSTLSQINQAANQVNAGSDQVSAGAQALSQGATEQASSVEELAATITEISGQVKNNAESALNARQQSEKATTEVEASNQKMQRLIDAMEDINRSSQEIGKVIKTIEDIAFQTNILALNAAVEAARAGAAGKGFAVVADEVRSLASKSAEAAKSTTALIEGSIRAVENGTQLADDTAKSLLSVVSGTQEVASIVNGISTASAEQASSIAQVTQGIDQISSVVQTNSATAEESAAASEELSGQAQMLNQLVGQFKLKDVVQGSDSVRQLPESEPDHSKLSYSTDKY